MSFERNNELLEQFLARYQGAGPFTFVDFGKVPQETDVLREWETNVNSFTTVLRKCGYKLGRTTRGDGANGSCPLYTASVNTLDGKMPVPAPLEYLLWFAQHLCKGEQRAILRERIIEIHLLGDDGEEPASVPTV